MEFPDEAAKVAFLRRPAAYDPCPDAVEVRETHMAWVFLAGGRAFKMKKPVRTEALDFSTLAKRAHFVGEEVRLNRRLAADVYLGAERLTAAPGGGLALGGAGRIVDWLVVMRRLPGELMLESRLAAGSCTGAEIDRLAARLVAFYRGLPAEPVRADAHAAGLRRQHRRTAEVLAHPGYGAASGRREAAVAAFEAALEATAPALADRVRSGRIVEGHGDLRPEHVCLEDPPVVIDCLEFNRALRLVDPFDEIAFLGLECARLGADWVLPRLRARLAEGLGDDPGDAVMALYWRYRALLRARLSLLHLARPDPRTPDKWRPQAEDYLALAAEAPLRCRS